MARIRVGPARGVNRVRRRLRELSIPDSRQVLVGLPQDSTDYPDGTSVIMVGAVHEFGSDAQNIPERSFLRSTATEEEANLKRFWRRQAHEILTGRANVDRVLGLLGQAFQAAVQKKITDIRTPANKQATINRKGSSNPLIDTGHLRQSIRYEIRNR